MSDEVIKIRIDLDGNNKKMFEDIKKKYNLEINTEAMRLIIKLAYHQAFGEEEQKKD